MPALARISISSFRVSWTASTPSRFLSPQQGRRPPEGARTVGYNAAQLDGLSPAWFAMVRRVGVPIEVAGHVMYPGFRFATVQGQNFHWFLRRNCAVTPGQLGLVYLSLCVVTLALGWMFWVQGATLVLPIAWLEL